MGTMTAEQAAEAAKGLTFEIVWASLLKLEENIKAQAEEAAKDRKKIDEALIEMRKTVSDLSKNMGGLGNLQGRLTEAMFEAELCNKFYDIGLPFTKQTSRHVFKEDKLFIAEADVFLENGELAMPVEIKTELNIEDVNDHLERIDNIRAHMDANGDRRKLLGAVAGEIIEKSVENYALKKGLYVVKQNGESVAIADLPQYFTPREW